LKQRSKPGYRQDSRLPGVARNGLMTGMERDEESGGDDFRPSTTRGGCGSTICSIAGVFGGLFLLATLIAFVRAPWPRGWILILLLSGIVVGAVTGFRVFNRKR
jgi:hypothetical protein